MSPKEQAQQGVKAPYISQNVWKPFFEKMRQVKRPTTLTSTDLTAYGMPSVPALQSAIRFLGLIDDKGNTTDKLQLIQAEGEAFKKNLKDLLHAAYGDLFEKHPLEHAKYEGIVNYLSQKYSNASKKKMAKSFAVLCQMAGLDSPAFTKMRSFGATELPARVDVVARQAKKKAVHSPKHGEGEALPSDQEDLVKEYIKANPMPTGVQWDADTLRAYFEQYRTTIEMLRGKRTKKEGE